MIERNRMSRYDADRCPASHQSSAFQLTICACSHILVDSVTHLWPVSLNSIPDDTDHKITDILAFYVTAVNITVRPVDLSHCLLV